MKFLKKIEHYNKLFFTFILKLIFRNKRLELPLDPSKIRKILIFRYDAIGDMIVTLPVVRYINEQLPTATVDILASDRNYNVIQYDTSVSNYFILKKKFINQIKLIIQLRKQNYDVIFGFVLSKTTLAGIIANLISHKQTIKVTISHEERNKTYSVYFNVLVNILDCRNKMTMAELQTLIVCKTFGWEFEPARLQISLCIPNDFLHNAETYFNDFKNYKKVIVNISAGNPYRMLSTEKNIELLTALIKKYPDFKFFICSAPSEISNSNIIENAMNGRVNILPRKAKFMEVAAFYGYADYVITPDTSFVHVTAAMSKPIVVLYSLMASHLNEWMPFGVSYRKVFTNGKQPLSTLEVSDIVAAFNDLCLPE